MVFVMLLISQTKNADGARRSYKAPKNQMFDISHVTIGGFAVAQGALIIVDESLEEPGADLGLERQYLVFYDMAIDGQLVSILIKHKCKFLTIGGRNSSTAISYTVQVFGEFVNASRTDLIWEWFRKGR